MTKRLLVIFGLFFSVLYLPVWVTLPAIVFYFFYFDKFYEGLGIVLLMDLLFGVADPRFFNIQIFTFLLMLVLFLIITFLKKKMKFYTQYGT